MIPAPILFIFRRVAGRIRLRQTQLYAEPICWRHVTHVGSVLYCHTFSCRWFRAWMASPYLWRCVATTAVGHPQPPTMDAPDTASHLPSVLPRVPTHPVDCLRAIVLPSCAVCGQPTRYFCGGCSAMPAFCSSEHFMRVRITSRLSCPVSLTLFCQLWPIHSMTCGRVVINPTYATPSSVQSGEQARSLSCAVTLPTRRMTPAPVALTEVQLRMPVINARPYDYVVTAMYAKHDGRKYS